MKFQLLIIQLSTEFQLLINSTEHEISAAYKKTMKMCYRSLNFMKFGQHILNTYTDGFYVEMYLDKDRNVLKF